MRSLALTLILTTLAATGCAGSRFRPTVGETGVPGAGGAPAGIPDTGPEKRTERKRVADKREITTLVADDRSTCPVNEKRFQETRVGDYVWCMWSSGD